MTDITGCSMSSDGSSIVVMGNNSTLPIYMEINSRDGYISKFISLESKDATAMPKVPHTYSTTSAVMTDKKDPFDGKEYVYMSFVMDDKIKMMRFLTK